MRINLDPSQVGLDASSTKAGSPKRVLLVEDDEELAILLAEALEQAGYQVQRAVSGDEALQLSAAFCPEVALLNIELPGLDGVALARKLTDQHAAAPPRLFVVSGFNRPSDRPNAAAAGFDRYFVKPVMPDVLHLAMTDPTYPRGKLAR